MDQQIATVNGSPIDGKALNAAMQSLAREHFHATLDEVPPESHQELRAMALERLIARELIFQAALAQGIIAGDDSVEEESARILRMMGNPADFWKRLAERGMDEVTFLRMVRKDVTVEQMSVQKCREIEEPGEDEIKDFFFAHPDQLRGHERVRASHILLPVDPEHPEKSLEQANMVKIKASQGDFAETAKAHSICASAPGGGELGFIRREDVDPSFADAAFSQVVNEVGEPVRTPYGYHLIKITAREIPAPPTLEEARDKIVAFLKQAKSSRLIEEWVASLRQGAEIIFPDN